MTHTYKPFELEENIKDPLLHSNEIGSSFFYHLKYFSLILEFDDDTIPPNFDFCQKHLVTLFNLFVKIPLISKPHQSGLKTQQKMTFANAVPLVWFENISIFSIKSQ